MLTAAEPDPSAPASPVLKRKIAAIVAADVVGYSRLVAADEERTLHDLAAARQVFDGAVRRSGGRIFNTAGDSVMCEFDSAVEAVRVAIDIQARLAERNAPVPPARRIVFRIGITIGDVVERDGDLLGDGVNIAARLESLAEPGGICVSRSVQEAVANKVPAVFRDGGERRVKNIPQPIYAFMIAPPAGRGASDGRADGPGSAHSSGPVADAASPELRPGTRTAPASATGRTSLSRRLLVSGMTLLGLIVVTSVVVERNTVATAPGDRPDTTARFEADTRAPAADTARSNDPVRPDGAKGGSARTEPPKAEPAKPDAARTDATKPDAPKPEATKMEAASPALRAASPAESAAQFAALARQGRIADPATLAELYHNARWLEGRGDRAGALKLYAALAPSGAAFADVALRYAAALRAASGPAVARGAFADLARNAPSRAVSLAHILQAEPEERRLRLEAFVAANPDGGVADYLLAEDYLGRSGGPTLTERRLAFDALDRFLEADSAGEIAPAFLDGSLLASWLENARRRRADIETFVSGAPSRPSVAFSRQETGWLATISLPEPALAVATRLGEQGEFVPSGLLASADPRTGRPAPNLRVSLPSLPGRTTLYIAYTDRSGREAGPFAQTFDPRAALVSAEREVLEKYPDSWVSFRADVPDVLSISQILSNRCAIASALIGFNDAAPERPLPLPACDERAPGALPADVRSAIALPPGVDSVQLKLAYADGTESATRVFRRP